jgi:uncharacterized membrane protein SpoIIM required for sporulation
MDIDSFIQQRRPAWVRLEEACKDGRRGLAKLTGPEIQELVTTYLVVTGDLSEVQTRYRDRQLSAYLSGVLASASAALYSSRPRTVGGLARVFGAHYRVALRNTRPYILVAAAVLFGVMALTYFWVIASPEAQNGVIPPQAREALEQAGGPERNSDLRGMGPAVSGFIFFNNARVALLAFATGITAGAGTVALLIYNAYIVGALGGAYSATGNAWEFWALILPHGLLELTAICIAAGSGLRIGWSVISPGDRLRSRALAEESGEAVLAVVGVIPAFLVAALIEGLVTGTSVPVAVQMTLGVAAELAYLAFVADWPRRRQPRPLRATAARTL